MRVGEGGKGRDEPLAAELEEETDAAVGGDTLANC